MLYVIWLVASLAVLFVEGKGIMVPEFMEHLDPAMKIVFFANIGFICWYTVFLLIPKNQHRSKCYLNCCELCLICCILGCSLAVMLSTTFSIPFFIAISLPLFFFLGVLRGVLKDRREIAKRRRDEQREISKRRRYERTSYYKITKRPYCFTKKDAYLTEEDDDAMAKAKAKAKGFYGEYLTYECLRPFEKKAFEKRESKLLFSLLIPAYGNDKTEIDIVMLSPKGIFVFEVKHWSGSISGEEQDQNWTQTLPNGDEYTKYNPIKQNALHVKHLEKILKLKRPIWSIIVFSGDGELENIREGNDKVRVVTIHRLKAIIEKIYETADDCISEIEMEELSKDLFPYTQASKEERQKHIENSQLQSNTN